MATCERCAGCVPKSAEGSPSLSGFMVRWVAIGRKARPTAQRSDGTTMIEFADDAAIFARLCWPCSYTVFRRGLRDRWTRRNVNLHGLRPSLGFAHRENSLDPYRDRGWMNLAVLRRIGGYGRPSRLPLPGKVGPR